MDAYDKSRRSRGKNFTVNQDKQICLSWIRAKQQEELNDNNNSDEIRSFPLNIWDTLFEHALSKDASFENRTVGALRARFIKIRCSVRRFAECYSRVIQEEKDSSEALDQAMHYYKTSCNEDFKFLYCYFILKQYHLFNDLPEIKSDRINATGMTDEENGQFEMSAQNRQKILELFIDEQCDISDSEDVFPDASVNNRKPKTRGKNFAVEHDKQICLSWIHTKKEQSENVYRLVPFNFWIALRQHAVSLDPDFEARSEVAIRSRFLMIQRSCRIFYDYYTAATQHACDSSEAIEISIQNYMEQCKEDFRFLECFQILQEYLKLSTTEDEPTQSLDISETKLETNSDKDDTSNSSESKVKIELCSPEEIKTEPVDQNTDDDEPCFPSKDITYSDRQKYAHGGRGKNFTVRLDKLICESWIEVRKIESTYDASSGIPFNFYENLYDHAVAKDSSFKNRSLNSLRIRLMCIFRSVRQFYEFYKIYEPDNGELNKNAVQQALQLYQRNYNVKFKFMDCWMLLRKYSQFYEFLQNTSAKGENSRSVKVAVENPNCKPQRKPIRQDEIQALLRASCDVGIEEARSRGERIEAMIYDVQQQMAMYGQFKERKLYLIKQMYDKTEREYKHGQLKPYPPEARVLWGRCGNSSEEEKKNDANWEKLIQFILDKKNGKSFFSDLEIKELIKQAIERNVESANHIEQKIIFMNILNDMKRKKLCRRKNAELLQKDYNRLKKLFLSGSSCSLPADAAKLWNLGAKDEESETVPIEHVDLNECIMKIEQGFCRICQTKLIKASKNLFDEHDGRTYADIISDSINVKMADDSSESSLICDTCSNFIENLATFVEQCRNSCSTMKAIEDRAEDDKLNFGISDATIEFLTEEASNITANQLNGFDYFSNENTMEVDSEINFPETSSDVHYSAEDQEKRSENYAGDETRKQINYQKYIESRSTQSWRSKKKQCHICGKSVIDLATHMESHMEKGFQCQFCDRICPNRRQLKVHMNRHTKKQPFPCRYCDKVFYVWSSRQGHERNVHKNLTFKCDVCDSEYRHKSYLDAHKKFVHLGIRKLKCTKCIFSTSIKTRLLNHVRSIHTSERPYKCSVCDHQSNSNTGYYIHFQRHKKSGEATCYSIKCAYCDELFTKDASLEVHIVKQHLEHAVIL